MRILIMALVMEQVFIALFFIKHLVDLRRRKNAEKSRKLAEELHAKLARESSIDCRFDSTFHRLDLLEIAVDSLKRKTGNNI